MNITLLIWFHMYICPSSLFPILTQPDIPLKVPGADAIDHHALEYMIIDC